MTQDALGDGDLDRELIEFQDRVIGRLRAALLMLGKSAEEVTRIAMDADGDCGKYEHGQQLRAYIDSVFTIRDQASS